MCSRSPLLVILGATGTGKTKLSLELAKRFNGELISADSMQVYRGLDVITNKVTPEEKAVAPHHLIDFLDPCKKYKVLDFRNAALPIIKRLHKEQKLPIIVGGTYYYIESLLWTVLVADEEKPQSPIMPLVCLKEMRNLLGYLNRDLKNKLEDKRVPWKQCDFDAVESRIREITEWGLIGVNVGGVCASVSLKENSEDDIVGENENEESAFVRADRLEAKVVEVSAEGGAGCTNEQWEKINSVIETCLSEARSAVRDFLEKLGFQAEKELSKIEEDTNREFHERLRAADPLMASTLHPNNRRKIIRSLEILEEKGRPHSEILNEQRSMNGGSNLGGPLRFPDSILLWLTCDEEVLDKRLDDRVDQMLAKGLVLEMEEFHEKYNQERVQNKDMTTAYTQGIFQSIGFKEFHPYLILTQDERESEKGKKLLNECVDALKKATRRYARRQKKWIKNRLIRAGDRQVPKIFSLDATDPDKWDTEVYEPAQQIVDRFLNDPEAAMPIDPLPSEEPLRQEMKEFVCDVCQRTLIGTLQWGIHKKSKKHQRVAKKLKKIAADGDEERPAKRAKEDSECL